MNCGHGFASAGVAQAFAGRIDAIGGKGSSSYFDAGSRAARIVAAAVVGGTTSTITGGKFANGAMTGAFSRAFNDEMHQNSQLEKARLRQEAWRAKHPIPSFGKVLSEGTWWADNIDEIGAVSNEMSRLTGHAAGATLILGQVEFAVPLGIFSAGTGLISAGIDFMGGSPDALGAEALSQGKNIGRENLVKMLPGPAKVPVNIAMVIADRSMQEVFYQVGK